MTNEITSEKEQATSPNAKKDSYEYVDLGLPSGLLWATCNIGATQPEEIGDFFAYGDVRESAVNRMTSTKCITKGEKIPQLISEGILDSNGNLTVQYDAAVFNLGENWRMPTIAEFDELCKYCNWSIFTINGIKGWKIESTKKGKTNWIFLPFHSGSACYPSGNYRSSSYRTDSTSYDFWLRHDKVEINWDYSEAILPIRPVRNTMPGMKIDEELMKQLHYK